MSIWWYVLPAVLVLVLINVVLVVLLARTVGQEEPDTH